MQNAHVSQSTKGKHVIVCMSDYYVLKPCSRMHALDNFLEIEDIFINISVSSFIFCASLDVLSMATALDDFIAPDCRFINIKKGQMVYVYSKLVPDEGAGVFWSGSVRAYLFHLTKGTAGTNKCELSGLYKQNVEIDVWSNVHFHSIRNDYKFSEDG